MRLVRFCSQAAIGWWCWIDAVVYDGTLEDNLPDDKKFKAVNFAFWMPGIVATVGVVMYVRAALVWAISSDWRVY